MAPGVRIAKRCIMRQTTEYIIDVEPHHLCTVAFLICVYAILQLLTTDAFTA